ncbi:MAG: hypothetical protein LBE06_01565 [Azoarcus sp.]|jgi:hypothetical protein|nr:hypothetical protein [Azoarcus sp.]
MTHDELISNLSNIGIPERDYSLGSIRYSGDCICVLLEDTKWKVYYVERDKPEELAMFDSAEDAYDFVYKSYCKWYKIP